MHNRLTKEIEQLDLTPEMRMELKNLVVQKQKLEQLQQKKNQSNKELEKANSRLFKQLSNEYPVEFILDKDFIIQKIKNWEHTSLRPEIKDELLNTDFFSLFDENHREEIQLTFKDMSEFEIRKLTSCIAPEPESTDIELELGWCQVKENAYHVLLKKHRNGWSLSTNNKNYLMCEINLHGRIQRCNHNFIKKFNTDYNKVINTHIKSWIHPLFTNKIEQVLSRIVYENESNVQTILFKNDKPENNLGYSCTFIPGIVSQTISIIAFTTHTNERDDADLFLNEQLYRTLADNLPEMNVFLFNRDYTFLLVAGKELEAQGFDRTHFEGRSLSEVYNNDMLNEIHPIYKAALEGRTIQKEVRWNQQYYRMESVPLRNKDNRVYAGMVISQNITQEKEVENQLKIAKEAAENASRTKSEFLANMSHEIRTPLNAIIGFSEQLDKSDLNERQRKFTGLITESSNHLLSIVNEILILFKLEAGKVHIEREYFRLPTVIEDIYSLFKIRSEKKSLDFSYHIDKQIEPILFGDAFRLKQILLNLLSNAIKFTDFGSVSLEVSLSDKKNENYWVQFVVKDTGIGMDEEELQKIFTEFSQADGSITRRYGGSGLGLTITRKLVDLYGGKINVNSTKNVGTEFILKLPFRIGKVTDIIEEEPMISIDKELLGNVGKVLLVDDDETNRFLGETILANWGLTFDIASDGAEAIEKLTNNRYDLLLLDIHMPKISGIDVTKFIRSQKNNPNHEIKIIAITANIVRGDVIRYMSAGMDNYIIKPFREQELFNKICHVFQIKAMSDETQNIEEELLVLKEKKQTEEKPFKLDELIHVAKGDPRFYNKMIHSFISNTQNGLEQMASESEKAHWENVGEAAHKLISSCRFFQLNKMADTLKEIENHTLINTNPKEATKYITIFEQSAREILPMLEKEIIKDENNLKS